jgi:Tol biopolymer transport system component
VLFVRREQSGSSIMQASALGGGATVLMRDEQATDVRGLDVAPDGASIVYARRADGADPYQVVVASLATGDARPVTNPEASTLGDIDPLYARDGRSVYFVRSVNEVTKDLYSVSIDGGEPERLTFDNRKINGLTWSPDGDALLFTSTRSGMYRVWEVDPDGGTPQLVPLGTEDVQQPSTVPGIGYIAYEQWMHRAQLKRIGLDSNTDAEVDDYPRSTRWDASPAWSPDGSRIAFVSNRGGPQAIWVSELDAGNALQVADLGGAFVDNPAWSPGGETIAFDASPDGRTAVYVVAPEGGVPQRFTNGVGDSRAPAWSQDGEWLYFESNASGTWEVYALAVRGGEPQRITTDGGINPAESVDGQWLIYSKPDTPGLWRRPRQDWGDGDAAADEELLTTELDARDQWNWTPASDGIYFVRRPASGPPVLSMLDPENGAVAGIVELGADFQGLGLDLAPDESELIFAEMLLPESDLRLATPRHDTD